MNGKKIVYSVSEQKSYGLPSLPSNIYISSVSNGQLTYNPGNITVTLLPTHQESNTRELWRRLLAEAGLSLVAGSFEEGATVNSKTDAVWHIAAGQCYFWGGAFPKTVAAGSTPASTDGVGIGAWVSVGDGSLRQDLVIGMTETIPDGVTSLDAFANLPLNIYGSDYPPVNVLSIAEGVPGTSTVISVSDATNFKSGRYLILSGDRKVSCGVRILAVSGTNIEIDFSHSGIVYGTLTGVTAKPINSVIKTSTGLQVRNVIYAIKNLAIEATGEYGLVVGGGYYPESQGGSCSVWDANNVIVDGGSVCGILVSGSGSQLGINGVHVSNANISLECIYSASVRGTEFTSYKSGEDSLKVEHTADCYIRGGSIYRPQSQSCIGSRYSAAVEFSDAYMADGAISFATSQFASYLSLRNIVMKGNATYAVNCIDGAVTVINNIDASGATGNYAIRSEKHSVVRQAGDNSDFSGYSALTTIVNAHVDINGITYSGKKIQSTLTVGTIAANSRYSQQRTVTGYIISNAVPLHLTVLSDLPIGIISDVLAVSDNTIRVTFQNITAAPVNVGDVNILISW